MTTEGKHHGFRVDVVRWLLAAALAALSLSVFAKRDTTRYDDFSWAGDGGRATQNWGTSSTGTGARATATSGGASFQPPNGKPLPWGTAPGNHAKPKWGATARDMAKSLVNPRAVSGLGAIAFFAVPIFKELADQACVGVFGGTLKAGAVWDECVYTTTDGYLFCTMDCGNNNDGPGPWHSSLAGAWADYDAAFPSQYRTNVRISPYPSGTVYYDIMCRPWECTGIAQADAFISARRKSATVTQKDPDCTPHIDHPDCSRVSIGNQAAEDKLTEVIEQWCQADFLYGRGAGDGKCAAVAEGIINNGLTLPATDQAASGPTTIRGNDEVVEDTAPDGRKRRTTTRTDRTITYNPDGSVTYTSTQYTKTEYQNPTTGEWEVEGEETKTTDDKRTACEKDPNGSECKTQKEQESQKDDRDVPDGEVPKATKELVFTVEDMGWGNGSCPAPFSWSDKLGTHSINLTPYCNAIVSYVKPLLLAVAAFSALMIALGGIKQEA